MLRKLTFENIFFIVLSASFFVGIWHALPMLTVVNDEMYYVGGVLRAIEHHTIIPVVDDVPYGTLSYLLSYIVTIPTLALMLPFFGFHIVELKLFLVQSPELMYVMLRVINACLALVVLFFINKLLKKEIENTKLRLFIILLFFTNIITSLIFRTGKMWVMSMMLITISFYYLYKSLSLEENRRALKRNIFLSILFSFLAVSNFPLASFCLINIPIIFLFYRKDKELLWSIVKYILIGSLVMVLVLLLNFDSIKHQIISVFTDYHPISEGLTNELGFWDSFSSYAKKLFLLFPLPILVLALSLRDGVKNKLLFFTSGLYFITYFFVITFVANWTVELEVSLRYLFPFGFFLTFILASLNLKFKKSFYVIGFVSIVYYVFTLYHLSVPTTYNLAYDWVNENLSGEEVLVLNNVPQLELKQNKTSALLVKSNYCSSKCKNIIERNLNSSFEPIVVVSEISSNTNLPKIETVYQIEERPLKLMDSKLVASFSNPEELFHSVDYNMGNYFDWSYFTTKNLGKDIYIYKIKS